MKNIYWMEKEKTTRILYLLDNIEYKINLLLKIFNYDEESNSSVS